MKAFVSALGGKFPTGETNISPQQTNFVPVDILKKSRGEKFRGPAFSGNSACQLFFH
ncbi:hypothetical protein JOC37_000027 [Desulfohalotomaculum tongense]|nr:hypothetical protein [Desulforadius tongensis]